MVTTQTQLRRGTASQCDAMTPATAEVVVDLTNDRLRLGDASRAGGFHIPNSIDIQGQKMTYAAATGTNTIAATYSPVPEALTDGMSFSFKAQNSNTGAATFNPNGAGNDDIVINGDTALEPLVGGEILAGGIYTVRRTGSQWHLISSGGGQTDYIAFRAVKTGILNAGGAFIKLDFTSETFDLGGYYDAGNSRWTPPAGYYSVGATIYVQQPSYTFRSLAIYVNGAIYSQSRNGASSSGASSYDVYDSVYLDGNDYVEIYFDATGGQISTDCRFFGSKVG